MNQIEPELEPSAPPLDGPVPRFGSQDFRTRYETRPILFAREILQVHLWSIQRLILTSALKNRRTVVPAGFSVGKTFVSAIAVLAFILTRPMSKVVTTAPGSNQVANLLWSKIHFFIQTYLVPIGFPEEALLQVMLRIYPEWYAVGISPREAVNFQGYHAQHIMVILDEAPGVRREIYEGADSLIASGSDAHMLMIGNPIEAGGHFYDACVSPDWNMIRISCLDSPLFTDEAKDTPQRLLEELVQPEWVAEKERQWGLNSALYQSKVCGLFPEEADNTAIPLKWVELAISKDILPGMNLPRHLGCDIAWEGDDHSVYVARIGNHLEVVGFDFKKDPMEVAARIIRLCIDLEISIVCIDSIGLGAGCYVAVRNAKEEGILPNTEVFGTKASEKARDPAMFPNKRSEMWWMLREALHPETGFLQLPDNDLLRSDLSQARYTLTTKGQIQIEPKKKMKTRLGRSPDYADAAMFAMEAQYHMNYKPLLKEAYGHLSGENRSGESVIPSVMGTVQDMP